MSAFETSLNVVATDVATPTEEALEEGAPPILEVNLVVGLAIPVPQGGQMGLAQIGIGKYTYALPKEAAVEFFKKGLEAAEALPDEQRSKIEIATSLDGVDKVQEQIDHLKGA